MTFLSPKAELGTDVARVVDAFIQTPLSEEHESEFIVLENRSNVSVLRFEFDFLVEKSFFIELSNTSVFPLLFVLWLELFFLFIVSLVDFAFKHVKMSLLDDGLLIVIAHMSDLGMHVLV